MHYIESINDAAVDGNFLSNENSHECGKEIGIGVLHILCQILFPEVFFGLNALIELVWPEQVDDFRG